MTETDHDPYIQGVDAHDAGQPITADPYEHGEESADWLDGWNAAAEAATDDEADRATTQGEAAP